MDRPSNFPHELLICAVCAAVGLSITLLGILIAAAVIASGSMDASRILPICIIAPGIGSAISGFLACRRIRKRAVLTGVLTGVIFLALLALLGLIFFPAISVSAGFLPPAVSVMVGGLLGAVLSALR